MKFVWLALACLGPVSASAEPWFWRYPLPQGNDLHSVVYGAGQFVAAGNYASILTSSNGVQWIVRNLESPHEFFDLTHGGTSFVAVGRTFYDQMGTFRSAVATSINGVAWNVVEDVLPAGIFLHRVAFGNGVFVAVPSLYSGQTGSVVYTSANGVTWTAQAVGVGIANKICFGNGTFILGGVFPTSGAPLIWTSPNGVTWTAQGVPSISAFDTISFAGGRFVAAGFVYPNSMYFGVSSNGANWNSSIESPVVGYWPISIAGAPDGTLAMLAGGSPQPSIYTSTDGLTWRAQTNAAPGLQLECLSYGAGRFIGVGENGNHATSADGTNWTVYNAATDNNFRGVTYGAGEFVAVGNGGTNMFSTDGVTWQHDPQHTLTSANLHDVIFAGGKYVAVGNDGDVLVKTPGGAWSFAASGTSDPLFAAAYGNGRYVAVGGYCSSSGGTTVCQSRVIVSTNSVQWEDRTPIGSRLHGVTFAANRFVAVGRFCLFSSSDGLTWTNNGYAPSQYLKSVTYGAGLFVAVGEFGSTILISPDGLNWSPIPSGLGSGVELDEVVHNGEQFMAVGNSGTIITSTNGINWSRVHSPTATNLRSVAANGNNWVIVGNNEQILQSGTPLVDQPFCPTTWFPRFTGTTNTLEDVVYADGRFLAVGRFYARTASTNGVIWTNLPPFTGADLYGVAHGNGRYIATGLGGVFATSTNYTNWAIAGSLNQVLYSAAYGNGVFVLVGTNGCTVMTTNGIAYVPFVRTSSNSLNGVTYGGGRFVAAGRNGTIMSAPWPGTNWTTISAFHPSVHLQDIAYGDGVFVAVGGTNVILVSQDGLNWSRASSTSSAELRSVCYGNGHFVAIGNGTEANDGLLVSADGSMWRTYDLPRTNRWNDIGYGNGSFLIVGDRGMALQNIGLPFFTSQPTSRDACVSDSIVLTGIVQSSCGSDFQWHRNGAAIPGENASTLSIPYVLPTHGGSYSLSASNMFGLVASAPAVLQVNACRAVDFWTNSQAGPSGLPLYSAVCAGDRIIAVGSAGAILYSEDGHSWTNAVNPTNTTLNAVAYGNGITVAVGVFGVALWTVDGINWTLSNTGTNRTLNAIAFGAGQFVGVGHLGTILTSTNGATWQGRNSGTNRTWAGIAYSDGVFAAVGLGLVAVSADGTNWQLHSTGSGSSLRSIAHGNDVWVAVGSGGAILASTNLVNWTPQDSPTTAPLDSVVYGNGQFVAAGANGTVVSSADGRAWVFRRSTTAEDLNSIVHCGNSFQAVGANGIALQSSYAGPPTIAVRRDLPLASLDLTAELGAPLRIETRTNVTDAAWTLLLSTTNLYPSTRVTDPQTTNSPQKYYRAVVPPTN